jgi:hypothetical protein
MLRFPNNAARRPQGAQGLAKSCVSIVQFEDGRCHP